jgi:hypothetical protein
VYEDINEEISSQGWMINLTIGKQKCAFGSEHTAPLPQQLRQEIFSNFCISGLLRLVADLSDVMAPFLLRYYLVAINETRLLGPAGDSKQVNRAIAIAASIVCVLFIQTICVNHSIYQGTIAGFKTRSLLMSTIFSRALQHCSYTVGTENSQVSVPFKWRHVYAAKADHGSFAEKSCLQPRHA